MTDELSDKRRQNFFIVDNRFMDEFAAHLGVYGIATYMALLRYAGQKQQAFPSHATIAEMIGCSKRKVQYAISALIDCGMLEVEHRHTDQGHQSNIYTIVSLHDPIAQDAIGIARDAIPLWHHVPHPIAPRATEEETVKKKEVEEETATATAAVDIVMDTWLSNMPGSMTPVITDGLTDLEKDYSSAEIVKAIGIACERNKRNLGYVRGILQRGVDLNAPNSSQPVVISVEPGDPAPW